MFTEKIILSTVLAILVIYPLHAEIFKWTDENGKVHYGDRPVENSQQIQVREQSPNKPAMTREQREERRARLLQAFDEDRAKKNKQKAKQAKEQAKNQRKCIVARDRLRNQERASSLYNLDKNGNRITLSEAERERSHERLRAQIAKYCK